jgi:carbonic anhydrase/acetyltransferase-like protein (isoleucine patch superfamily)
MLHHYKGKWPKLGKRVYIAEGAQIIGDVEIGDHSSIWYNTVIRGDVYYVRIGKHTNIQDGCIGHVQKDQCALILKDYVTVGHGVMMHGCTIESHCLIGMRATILNDVVIGEYSIVGAGALITERTIIPPRSLVLGFPAKVKRRLTDEEVARIDQYADRYYQYKETYLTMHDAKREPARGASARVAQARQGAASREARSPKGRAKP